MTGDSGSTDSDSGARPFGAEVEYLPDADARPIEVGGPTLTLRSPGTLIVDHHPRIGLETRIRVSASGSFWLRIMSVTIESHGAQEEVTSDDLRNVRVIDLLRQHLPPHAGWTPLTAHALASEAYPTAIRDQWPSPGAMGEVARTYNVALALRLHPIKAVTDAFGISRSTAHRWINQCRESGLIVGG
ncbi:helix-turn-helix domain-containing protein [Microbacterium paraoxydans]|uniref:helix-turn-helix domain-containing protein n=1 Tax=Microbacterium paraoxydans TaxID=199592 RepID=UPI0035ABAF62